MRFFRNKMQMKSLIDRVLKIHGVIILWTIWALSGDHRIQHIFELQRASIDVSILMWDWMLFSCHTVSIGCSRYVICPVSLLVHMVAVSVDTHCELETDKSWLGTNPGILVSTCTDFNLWLWNQRVSGIACSGLCWLSHLLCTCNWITAWKKAHSNCGCTSDVQILGVTSI